MNISSGSGNYSLPQANFFWDYRKISLSFANSRFQSAKSHPPVGVPITPWLISRVQSAAGRRIVRGNGGGGVVTLGIRVRRRDERSPPSNFLIFPIFTPDLPEFVPRTPLKPPVWALAGLKSLKERSFWEMWPQNRKNRPISPLNLFIYL